MLLVPRPFFLRYTIFVLPIEQAIRENLRDIEQRIEKACVKSGRSRYDITLIAVTKTIPAEIVQIAYDLGIRDFGENRYQEAQTKLDKLPKDARWHFIGTLQSNKAKRIAEQFAAIHTISSDTHIKEIGKADAKVDGLIEINIANEQQKAGINAERVDELLQQVLYCKAVIFRGLMTVGPFNLDPESMRPLFRRMWELNEQAGGQWLSMGMSNDFDVAIQEGSTHIRVGTALFGARNYR